MFPEHSKFTPAFEGLTALCPLCQRSAHIQYSLASHTLCTGGSSHTRPPSCHHGRHLLWPMRSALFIDCIRLHLLSWSKNYVTCLTDVSIMWSNNTFLGDNTSATGFLFLQRVWLERLTCKSGCHVSIPGRISLCHIHNVYQLVRQ